MDDCPQRSALIPLDSCVLECFGLVPVSLHRLLRPTGYEPCALTAPDVLAPPTPLCLRRIDPQYSLQHLLGAYSHSVTFSERI